MSESITHQIKNYQNLYETLRARRCDTTSGRLIRLKPSGSSYSYQRTAQQLLFLKVRNAAKHLRKQVQIEHAKTTFWQAPRSRNQRISWSTSFRQSLTFMCRHRSVFVDSNNAQWCAFGEKHMEGVGLVLWPPFSYKLWRTKVTLYWLTNQRQKDCMKQFQIMFHSVDIHCIPKISSIKWIPLARVYHTETNHVQIFPAIYWLQCHPRRIRAAENSVPLDP